MIPEFDIPIDTSSIQIVQQPSKTYKDRVENISGYVDNLDAVKQAVYHIIYTERYAYPIYPDWYGMELEKYIGKSFEYLQATLENDLRSALLQDDRIYDVRVTNLIKYGTDKAIATIDVYSTDGTLKDTEVTIGL